MLLTCVHCQTRNHVPEAALRLDPSCERCGRPLASGEVMELSEANYDAVIAGSELPILVDFWAPWSGPARMMEPQLNQAARQLKGRALLVKINSDASPRLAQRYGIRTIPTLTQMRAGQEVQRLSGAVQAPQILEWFQ
jgi:thioredoxin 2